MNYVVKKGLYITILVCLAAVVMAANPPKIGQNYPNPAKEITYVNVEFEAHEATLTISNVLGKAIEIKKLPYSGTYSLDVKDYVNGVYFLTLEANGEKVVRKITVKK